MPTEASYADNADDAIKRMMYLANRSIQGLARYPWQALRKTWTLTLTSETTYSLPSDWRAPIADTMFTGQKLWGVDFPTDASEWGYLKASDSAAGPTMRARLLGGSLEVHQPQSGDEVRVEYLSNTPVLDSTNTRKEKFTADTDSPVLDSDLVTQDIIWRYKRLVGQEWQSDLAEFKSLERTLRGQEAGAKTIRPGGEAWPTGVPYYELWRPVPNT